MIKCNNPFAFRPRFVTFWTVIVYLAVVVPLLYVHETVPPAPSDNDLHSGLDLSQAWQDLQELSRAYHPYNSHDNDRVRQFLVNRSSEILQRNGVDYQHVELQGPSADGSSPLSNSEDNTKSSSSTVTLFDDYANVSYVQQYGVVATASLTVPGYTNIYFEGNNFYVYVRGTEDPEGDWWRTETEYRKKHGGGGVLVNCHFDSVATGYGVTDDGVACVSMLQLLSYFTTSGRQPKNGIVLLFNNAEEPGLLGSRAFAKSPLMTFCHTFINLEGAGAGGRAILFRTTDLEVVKAYAGSPHPFGTVMAANAFDQGVVKSATDYQIFNDYYGLRGMDIAFYAPRARYHTEEDDVRHTSVNSIWHMLSSALTATEHLSQTTSTKFHGPRSDGHSDLVQNGKRTQGVWFDIFGSVWAAFALRGLFAWSLTLLVAAPLAIFVTSYVLMRKDKFYFFARELGLHSDDDDDPVKLKGWRGFFRFPVAMLVAGALTVASTLLVVKFNPFIVYSSGYAVWAMNISLFYFVSWIIMRCAHFVRPSALHRGYVHMWLFFFGWVVQVFAAVAEDRMHVGAVYFTVFLQTAVFLALMVSLLEQFALPGKQEFAQLLHDAHHARDRPEGHDEGTQSDPRGEDTQHVDDDDDDDDDNLAPTPTETTPLRSGDSNYGSNTHPTFASTYRSVARPTAEQAEADPGKPYDNEQAWSGRLPTWTWLVQLLLLVPVPLMLIGNLGLFTMSALQMTGADGGSLLVPVLGITFFSIVALLPMMPFIHRVTHHIPLFLLLVFIGTFIYNLVAFPFSNNHRYKLYFQQVVDLDAHTNKVSLTGVEEFVRPVIKAIPAAAGQDIGCGPASRPDLMACSYNVSWSELPDLVSGKEIEQLISVQASRSADGSSATLQIDALDTRMCYLDSNQPVYGFEVDGGSHLDTRFGSFPADGLKSMQLWRHDRNRGWNVTIRLAGDGGIAGHADPALPDAEDSWSNEELKLRAALTDDHTVTEDDDGLEITVRCAWSDANKPSTIPAYHEVQQYMPTWATASKANVGLVEVWKRYTV